MKFVQIAADKYLPYALDDQGRVWKYQEMSRRICEEPHHAHPCQYQNGGYWKLLDANYGAFPGWPPTPQEEAAREVEELLK